MSADGSSNRTFVRERDIASLISSRICHDLISPIGAIGNGVELMTMAGGGIAPEVSLIADSVTNANARIRFFRIAFGSASAGSTVASHEVRNILGDLDRRTRLKLSWEPGGALPRQRVKVAFLCLQCLESSMPYGGEVTVAQKISGWEISAVADRMKVDNRLWELLENPHADTLVTPSDVHFALVERAANNAGVALNMDIRADAIRIAF